MNQLTLAFDTATEECAIALGMVEPGVVGVIAERDLDAPRASLTRLLPTVAELLESANVAPGDLDAIVVGLGPGSFTGVRIGVSSAKGLAHALGVPLYGVSTLDAIARRFAHLDVLLGVVGDAMRGEVYPALFRCANGGCERLAPDTVSRPLSAAAAWATADEPPTILAGNGLRKHGDVFREALGPGATFAAEGLWTPTGRGLLRAYADDLAAGRVGDGDAGAVLPVYTRLSDAEETERDRANATADASAAQGSVPDSGVAGPEGGAL
ncbi:MAG: tRNA (adenosine(37)-N6)-threonylcarbamoyltransferase complex dimerization subunit type 1 TsaB [Actinomycetota bacterium]|jgi:tRNA threonylcarbamoyl adenosine modification protein YeaZ|nr:tRNA (adenosine(37)-N6)-threonylcarbamoyltransferase complex dimerization subunit type 1 TsaB [Actinomycetota bacterium]